MRHLWASWQIAQGQTSGGHGREKPVGLLGDVGLRQGYGWFPDGVSLLGHSAKLGKVSQCKHVGMWMHDVCVRIDVWTSMCLRVCLFFSIYVCLCVHYITLGGLKSVTGFFAELILDGLVACAPWGCLRCHTPCVTNTAPSSLNRTHTAC